MIDKETTVPIHTLDRAPFNPKGDIHGIYRAGLATSLSYFGVSDRLKIWPNPKSKGRYYVINGNQRLPLIIELRNLELICEHFGINQNDDLSEDPAVQKEFRSRLKAIKADPDNDKLFQGFHAKVMQSQIDVQIMARLDEDDAKLFVAAYDRNHAKTDEAKLVNSIVDEVRSKNQNVISRMVRPEKAYIQPLPRSNDLVSKVSPNISAAFEKPSDAPEKPEKQTKESTEFGAWGDPPKNEKVAPAQTSLIPFTVSLTRDGYKEINERILKLSSRIFRERTIIEALEQLTTALGDKPLDSDSIVVEIALLTLNKHQVAAESEKE